MIDVLIVASPGGHLKVAEELFAGSDFNLKFVTTKSHNGQIVNHETITEFNRDWKLFLAFMDAVRIFRSSNPRVIVSTGAGVAIPFFLMGFLTNRKLIYVESISRVHTLSLTGLLCYPFVDKFFVRNSELASRYKKAIYLG